MTKIATKTGDKGTTGLLSGGRVSKADHRIELVGCIDELSAAIGLCKSQWMNGKTVICTLPDVPEVDHSVFINLSNIQQVLIHIMGELATDPGKVRDGFKDKSLVELGQVVIDVEVSLLEAKLPEQTDWVLYGDHSELSARLDFASKLCRRAERQLVISNEITEYRPELVKYLNRLSDYLYLLARDNEQFTTN